MYVNEWRALHDKVEHLHRIAVTAPSAEMLQSFLAAILVVGVFTGKGIYCTFLLLSGAHHCAKAHSKMPETLLCV